MEAIDKNKMENSFRRTSEKLEDGKHEMGEKLNKLAAHASDRIVEAGERIATTAKDKSTEYYHDVENYIKANPIQASFIAAGIGFLLARKAKF